MSTACITPTVSPRRTRPIVVAIAAGALLLAGFVLVLRQAVAQGEAWRAAQQARVEARWKCQALPARGERRACLSRLDAPVLLAGTSASTPAQQLARLP